MEWSLPRCTWPAVGGFQPEVRGGAGSALELLFGGGWRLEVLVVERHCSWGRGKLKRSAWSACSWRQRSEVGGLGDGGDGGIRLRGF